MRKMMIKNNKIAVNEIFESIDGEGYHAGYPTVFFRVAGCNLRCFWCDTVYAFDEYGSQYMTPEEAFAAVQAYGIPHITITGGEPLVPENKEWMAVFIRKLLDAGFAVDVETNGSINYAYWKTEFQGRKFVIIADWKAPSSNMNEYMVEENLKILESQDIIKIVVQDGDFDEVQRVLDSGTQATIYISPVFGQVTMSKIPEFIMHNKKHKNLRCQIQMHKIFWKPGERGV